MLAQTLGMVEQGNVTVGQRRRPRPRPPRLPSLKSRSSRNRPRNRGVRSVLKYPLASSSSDVDKC